MKKILSTVAVVLAAVMLLSVSVFAGDEFVLRFKDCKDSGEDGTTVFPHGGSVVSGDDALVFTVDPGVKNHLHFYIMTGKAALFANVVRPFTENTVSASDYKYMKIKYKSECDNDKLTLYYVTYPDLNAHPGPVFEGEKAVNLDINPDGKWNSAVYDMGTLCGDKWQNYIGALRFDMNTEEYAHDEANKGKTFSIEYIAFFKTQAEADAYTGEAVDPNPDPDPNPGTSDFVVTAVTTVVAAAAAVIVLEKRRYTGK